MQKIANMQRTFTVNITTKFHYNQITLQVLDKITEIFRDTNISSRCKITLWWAWCVLLAVTQVSITNSTLA